MTGPSATVEKRFQMTVSVHLVLLKENHVLLLKRFQTGYDDGAYGLVSGSIDGKESATQAMIREALEEAGITLREKDLTCRCVMHLNRPDWEWEGMSLFFVANNWEGEIRNGEPDKCDEIQFFPLDRLPNNTIPYVKEGIRLSLKDNSQTFTEFGWD